MSKESEFLARLKETFRGEAEEHRAAILNGLLELEKEETGKERASAIVENIFREAHSLKGAARAVDIAGIERLCQGVEEIFSGLKRGHRGPEKRMYNVLFRALDQMAELTSGTLPVSDSELREVLKQLKAEGNAISDLKSVPGAPVIVEDSPGITSSRKTPITMPETVRISAARLGSIFLHAEEMLTVKQAMVRHAADLRELASKAGPLMQKLDGMATVAAMESLHAGERLDSLLTEIRTALMLPFSTLLEPFPRMVRDLAAEEGKEVSWEVLGEDTHVDRRVLEEIKDSLIHIVRNSISHGIEPPGEREKRGKPRAGIVSLRVERLENDKVDLIMSDDGAGVDLALVKSAAIAREFITDPEASVLKDEDALGLIFRSQLSTSTMITDISGRGLGLAIAREKVETVGGQLTVETTRGKGTVFRIQIPLSLATFRGVLVRSRGQTFVVPTANVDQVLRVDRSLTVSVENRETIPIDGRAVSLVNLGDVLGLEAVPEEEDLAESWLVFVLLVSGIRTAFRIDEVLGEQEVVVKSLGKQLARVRNISGATVLVTGDLVPILNPSDLLKSVSLAAGKAAGKDAKESGGAPAVKILVVEDSVTSRMLLKSILESAGYKVKTAVDGVEAFASLRVDEYDLLVSDIDMPRMNGFALCEKVRGFARTADLPIVLVTSLDSREDREKGIDAGANAYILKSGFDQGNLLEVVRRLL